MQSNTAPAPIELPAADLRSVALLALTVRDRIHDVLGALSCDPRVRGFTYTEGVLDELWAAWRNDSKVYLFALDFVASRDGLRLARTTAPWAMLPEAIAADADFRQAFAEYLPRRMVPGILSIRTADYQGRTPQSVALSRAAVLGGFEVQMADLKADWDDAPELAGALVRAPYLQGLLGDIALPPLELRLAFPLWTALLDEPALLAYLHGFFPEAPEFAPARIVSPNEGRTVGEQTGTEVRNVPAVAQDLPPAPAGQFLRVFVSDERVLGIFQLREADLRRAESGALFATRPQ